MLSCHSPIYGFPMDFTTLQKKSLHFKKNQISFPHLTLLSRLTLQIFTLTILNYFDFLQLITFFCTSRLSPIFCLTHSSHNPHYQPNSHVVFRVSCSCPGKLSVKDKKSQLFLTSTSLVLSFSQGSCHMLLKLLIPLYPLLGSQCRADGHLIGFFHIQILRAQHGAQLMVCICYLLQVKERKNELKKVWKGRRWGKLDFILYLKGNQLRQPMEINVLKNFNWIIKTHLGSSRKCFSVTFKSLSYFI